MEEVLGRPHAEKADRNQTRNGPGALQTKEPAAGKVKGQSSQGLGKEMRKAAGEERDACLRQWKIVGEVEQDEMIDGLEFWQEV